MPPCAEETVGPRAAIVDFKELEWKPIDGLDHEAHQIILRNPVPHIRRQQHRRVSVDFHEAGAHAANLTLLYRVVKSVDRLDLLFKVQSSSLVLHNNPLWNTQNPPAGRGRSGERMT